MVGLIACGVVLRVGAVFPGIAALWPTGCAALVLLAGDTGPVRRRPAADARPLRYVGDLSYSLYLWHWPVLVFSWCSPGATVDLAAARGHRALGRCSPSSPTTSSRSRCRAPDGRYRLAVAGLAAVLLASGLWQVEAVHGPGAPARSATSATPARPP